MHLQQGLLTSACGLSNSGSKLASYHGSLQLLPDGPVAATFNVDIVNGPQLLHHRLKAPSWQVSLSQDLAQSTTYLRS